MANTGDILFYSFIMACFVNCVDCFGLNTSPSEVRRIAREECNHVQNVHDVHSEESVQVRKKGKTRSSGM